MDEQQILRIGTISLDWSDWVPWLNVLIDNRGGGGILIPNQVPGVYEVSCADHEGQERLYIGKAGDLRFRVRQ
jgi:hypothetical protein